MRTTVAIDSLGKVRDKFDGIFLFIFGWSRTFVCSSVQSPSRNIFWVFIEFRFTFIEPLEFIKLRDKSNYFSKSKTWRKSRSTSYSLGCPQRTDFLNGTNFSGTLYTHFFFVSLSFLNTHEGSNKTDGELRIPGY